MNPDIIDDDASTANNNACDKFKLTVCTCIFPAINTQVSIICTGQVYNNLFSLQVQSCSSSISYDAVFVCKY